MRKNVFLSVISIVLLSAVAAITVQGFKEDYQDLDIECNELVGFAHDESINLYSNCHVKGFYTGQTLMAYLYREVSWTDDTNYWVDEVTYQGTNGMLLIKEDINQSLWGFVDKDFIGEFTDVLDLSGVRYGVNQSGWWNYIPPNQWVGVHYIVGYKIAFYVGKELIGITSPLSPGYPNYIDSSIRLAHDEVRVNGHVLSDFGLLEGRACIENPDGIVGALDKNEAIFYGTNQKDCGFIQVENPIGAASYTTSFPVNRYNLFVNMHSCPGQSCEYAVFAGVNGPNGFYQSGDWWYPGAMTLIANGTISEEASSWYSCGEVPTGTQQIVIVMLCSHGSGKLWIDATQLVPIGEIPQ